jgi:excisionase family DNA binding protein
MESRLILNRHTIHPILDVERSPTDPQKGDCLSTPMKRSKKPGIAPSLSQILTVREVSEYLRVHPATIYRLLRLKQIPGFLVGSDWRFDIDAIEHWSRGETKLP